MTRVAGDASFIARESQVLRASPSIRSSEDARIVATALAIGGCIVAGMGWNIPMLTTAGALAAIAAALVAPAAGLAIIAFMGPLTPPLVLPPPGFNAILVGAVLLGCVYRLPIDRPRIRLTAPIALLAAFMIYVGAQQVPEMVAGYAGTLGYQVYTNFRELLVGFGTVLAAVYVLGRRSPFLFLAVGLISASLSALLAVATMANPAVGPPVAGLVAHETLDRAVGSFGNPNYFGVFEAIAAVTAVGWMIGTQSRRLRLILLATAILLTTALVLSLSRGAVIAFAAGLACVGLTRTRGWTAAVVAGGLVVAAVVLFPLFLDWRLSISAAAGSVDASAALAESDSGRFGALIAGPQLFLTSPLFGIGWGHYSSMSAQFAGPGISLVAHNWYVGVLAEEGLVGVAIWALLLIALVNALRTRPTFPRSMGLGVLGAYAVGSLFLEAPTSFQTSAFPILVIVAALVSDWTAPFGSGRHLAKEEASAGSGSHPDGPRVSRSTPSIDP